MPHWALCLVLYDLYMFVKIQHIVGTICELSYIHKRAITYPVKTVQCVCFMLGKNNQHRIFCYVFAYFSQKTGFDFSCKSSKPIFWGKIRKML